MFDADVAAHSLRWRTLEAVEGAVQRVRNGFWVLLQGTVAATAAWVIAKYGLGHPDPFFRARGSGHRAQRHAR